MVIFKIKVIIVVLVVIVIVAVVMASCRESSIGYYCNSICGCVIVAIVLIPKVVAVMMTEMVEVAKIVTIRVARLVLQHFNPYFAVAILTIIISNYMHY